MSCPKDGCPSALVFPTQSKYKRHLTKKHFHEVVLYSCQVFHCKVSCRSRYDMKVHLLRVHNTAKGLVENILSKSQRNCRPNGSFINPSTVGTAQLRTRMFLQCRWYRNLWRFLHPLLILLWRFLPHILWNWNYQLRKDESSGFGNIYFKGSFSVSCSSTWCVHADQV